MRYRKFTQLNLFEQEKFSAKNWYGLTCYAPFGDLWLHGFKKNEIRAKGIRAKLPIKLFIQTALLELEKLPDFHSALAKKYLGRDYRPAYGCIVGWLDITKVEKITTSLISKQSSQELELGLWKENKNVWYGENPVILQTPVRCMGYGAAPWRIKGELLINLEKIIDKGKMHENTLQFKANSLL